MASISFYVGAYYLFLFAKRPQIKEHLPFALLCISMGFYDVFSAGLYNSVSLRQGIVWQRLQLDTVVPISVFLLWFSAIFTDQRNNRILRISIAWLLIILLAAFFASPRFSLSLAEPAIKHINLPGVVKIDYYEAVVGPVYQVELASAILSFIYLVPLFLRYSRGTGTGVPLLIVWGLMAYFIGVVNDTLVAERVYTFIYISEYCFFFILFAMAYTLLDRFVNLYGAFEELNKNLEHRVAERTSEIEILNEDLKRRAERDGLTGVYNRRFFNEYFEIEVKRASNYMEHRARLSTTDGNEMNFGLAFIDIDEFKLVNDTYGHPVGDKVLKEVIEIILGQMFTRDVLCRYGGDEFALILTKTSKSGILQAAEKIRNEVMLHEFRFDESRTVQHVTVSIGLVDFDEVLGAGNEAILKLADDRLLRAKSRGKNRIVCSEDA
jgi:diguanylate cyclase (GGDEF)-like protein